MLPPEIKIINFYFYFRTSVKVLAYLKRRPTEIDLNSVNRQ